MTNAKVRYSADKEFPGKFGPRINIVAETDDGVQVKIWENAGHFISQLEKGQRVNVYKDDKGNWHVSKPEPDQPTNGHAGHNGHDPRAAVGLTTMNKEEKLQLDAELQAYAKLHGRCWELAANSFPEGALPSDETIQKVATTLFIQITRKYAL